MIIIRSFNHMPPHSNLPQLVLTRNRLMRVTNLLPLMSHKIVIMAIIFGSTDVRF